MTKLILSLLFIGLFVASNPSLATLEIDVTQGQIAPTPIAIPDFIEGEGNEELAQKIPEVIGNDLEHSGLFRLLSKSSFIQDTASALRNPNFSEWRVLNAQCLLVGRVTSEGDKITVEFRLFDVFNGTQMVGVSISSNRNQWRRVAHRIADAVYNRVTGEAGYFDTRIAYIDESGPKKKRVRRLAIMDWDGHNNVYLTDGVHMVLTPRFSPNSKEIAYMAYVNKTAHVYVINVHTRKKRLVGHFKGMTFAPRFAPDGRVLLMSLAREGTTALYKMDMNSGSVSRLTQHSCIDTSPCFSPDGSQIVFTSDRSNPESCQEKIYIMDAHGGNVRRISFGDGKYSQPAWSPRGDLIAFTKQIEGRFYIGVMNVDGTNERLIADGHLVEAPSWSPNGRVLLFTKESGGKRGNSKLYAIDLTGRNLRIIKTPRDSSDGAWSRLLSE
ncbi:MAG: Tol-Pal system protein TolB [Alphaproteobacteria bacterium]|nr:Tol-Pal system protein TolB [Alphaproteobacteria bacterium]